VTREREFDSAGAGPASRWPAEALHRLAEGSAVSLTVSTADQMRELGRRLASAVAAGDLVILSGGLGS
jgi:tRNA threonylcarbamoyladenosine biosynthesis protein TsaE